MQSSIKVYRFLCRAILSRIVILAGICIKSFCMLEGDVWGHRKDLDEYFGVEKGLF